MPPNDSWTMRMPDDLHVHLRDEEDPDEEQNLLQETVWFTKWMSARALVMPNTKIPITTGRLVERYRKQIVHAARGAGFEPLMTAKLTQNTTVQDIRDYRSAGAVACKLYPEGATTNSHKGVTDVKALRNVYEEMAECDLVLSVHGEVPGAFCLDREELFLREIRWILREIPQLRVVLEHVSSAEGVRLIEAAPPKARIAATITPHHLVMTLDSVVGPPLRPHHYCLPIPKLPKDRQALQRAATSGNPRFFLGTDSAPHIRSRKECAAGCAGAFTAPIALPLLMSTFESLNALDKLEEFTSYFGAQFYGLPLNTGTITLRRDSWEVPPQYGRVVPFGAGEKMEWRIAT